MKIKIKRVDKDLPLPEYQTDGSVGFDLCSREDLVVNPGELKLIPFNVIIGTPPGYMFLLAPRSSLFKKKGLIQVNSVGIFDQDFCGDEDEGRLQVYNITDKPAEIKRGERIAQGVFVRVDIAKWDEVDEMGGSSRGGIGSTGSF